MMGIRRFGIPSGVLRMYLKKSLALLVLGLFLISAYPVLTKAGGSDIGDEIIPQELKDLKDIEIPDSYFIKNVGQIADPNILFYSPGGNVYFTSSGFYYRYGEIDPICDEMDNDLFSDSIDKIPTLFREHGVVLKYSFFDAYPTIPEGNGRCSWNTNYFKGSDPNQWYTEIPTYSEIYYKNVWDGIDILYKFSNKKICFIMDIEYKADPQVIAFRVEGQDSMSLSENNLIINIKNSEINSIGLNTYINYNNNKIKSSFILKEENVFSLTFDNPYNIKKIFIESYLMFSTLIGGKYNDNIYDLEIDSKGSVYITGETYSIDYPTTLGCFDSILNGVDVFVTKINSIGSSIIFSTFIGGLNFDIAKGISIDVEGNSYLTGLTLSNDFPVTSGVFQINLNGGDDVFVIKLNPMGSTLLYSTYIGGSNTDFGYDITVDGNGNSFITGLTYSIDYPATASSFDVTHNGWFDVFITKLNNIGSSLIYSTFIGGSNDDVGYGIDIDKNDNAYITGYTWFGNPDFPTTPGAFDTVHHPRDDVFVTKINNLGSSLIYSTFIGGSNDDRGSDITIDNYGNAYITGTTGYGIPNYPTTIGAYSTIHKGKKDAFVTKLNLDGSKLLYSSFIGGSEDDSANEISIDKSGNAYIVGCTVDANIDYPTTAQAYDNTHNGMGDVFVTALNANASKLIYSTFIGGSEFDNGIGMTIDTKGFAIIVGATYNGTIDYPTTNDTYDRIINNDNAFTDGFITKLQIDYDPPLFIDKTLKNATTGDPFIFGFSVIDNFNISQVYIEYWYERNEHNYLYPTMNLSYKSKIIIPYNSLHKLHYILNANDTFNNWNQSKETIVEILDDDLPFLREDRSIKETETSEIYTIEVDIRDNIRVNNVTVEYWFGEGSHTNVSMTGDGPYTYLVLIPSNFTDTLHYIIHSNDTSDNWNSTELRDVTVLDHDDPYFATYSFPSTLGTDEDLSVSIKAYDNVGIAGMYFRYAYGLGSPVNLTLGGSGDALIELHIPEDSIDSLNYTLSLVDTSGNWISFSGTIVIVDIIDPVSYPGEDITVDEDELTILNGSLSDDNIGIINWTWTVKGEGLTVTLYGKTVEYTFFEPGIYTVLLNVSDAAGNWNEKSFNITVKDVTDPVFKMTNINTPEDNDVILDGSLCSDNVGIVNWKWIFSSVGEDVTLDGVAPAYNFSEPGNYTVSLTIIDEAGNSVTSFFYVVVIDITKPSIDAGSDLTVLEGTIVSFRGSGSDNVGIVNWTWTFSDGVGNNVLYGQSISHLFSKPGTYTITLEVKDAGGNSMTDSFVLTVKKKDTLIPPDGNKTSEQDPNIIPFVIGGAVLILLILTIATAFFLMRKKKEPLPETVHETNDLVEGSPPEQIVPPVNDGGSPTVDSPIPEGSGEPAEETLPAPPQAIDPTTVEAPPEPGSNP